MATAVRLDDQIVTSAIAIGEANCRTAPKQIEHWIKIGRIMEDNPDLTYEFVRNCLKGMAESEAGETEPYVFG